MLVKSLVVVVITLPASAAEAVAEALDDADDGDAQEEGHQTAEPGHKLKTCRWNISRAV